MARKRKVAEVPFAVMMKLLKMSEKIFKQFDRFVTLLHNCEVSDQEAYKKMKNKRKK